MRRSVPSQPAIPTGLVLGLALAACLPALPARAQEAGSRTGAQVLSMPAGSRAPALAGAATAGHEDADVLFYNPAGAAGLEAAASATYQHHVVDIVYLGGAGAYRFGRIVLGATVAYLDFGRIDVLVPDPDFGGQTGRPDGSTATAAEASGRLVAAAPILGGRVRVGVSGGFLTTRIAEIARSTATFGAGVQTDIGPVAVGLAARNLGSDLQDDAIADTPLPAEVRLGGRYGWERGDGLGATASADLIHRLEPGETALAAGVEVGLLPDPAGVGAVARLGWSGSGDDVGALRLGAGVSIARFAVDYTYQDFDAFGGVHRFGVRGAGPRH